MMFSPLNVLLVDDDEDDYVLVRDSLNQVAKHVYKVEWAKSYQEALTAFDKRTHDVCLLDYHLGDHESSGLKLLTEARARNYPVPMIFFTGKGDHLIDLEAMRGGATDYLVKDSCTPELLERAIRYALERFQQQEALRHSEERFRRLVETAPDAILQIDETGRIALVNQRAETMFGYQRNELIGQSVEMLLLAHFRSAHTAHRSGIFPQPDGRSMGVGRDLIGRRKDGTEFPVEVGLSYSSSEDTTLALAFVTDITERIRTEDVRREADRFNHATFNALSAHIAILDEAGSILSVNQAWLNFAEANGMRSDYAWKGVNYLAVCDSSGSEPGASSVAAGIRLVISGAVDQFEYEYPCFSAIERRWFVVRVTRFLSYGAVRIVVAHENITAAKQAQELLARSEANLRAILDNSELSYVLMDAGKRVITSNRVAQIGAEAVFGRRYEVGDSFTAFLSDWNRDGFNRNFEVARCGEIASSEMSFVTPQGQTHYFAFRYFPAIASDGTVLGVCLSSQDITERKRAELALRESEEKFRVLTEQSIMGISIMQDDRIKYANQALSAINGYSVEEMMAWSSIDFARTVHPDDLAFAVDQARRKQRGDADVKTHYRYRIITKDGHVRWVEQFSNSVEFGGRPANLGTLIDVTERVYAEAQKLELELAKERAAGLKSLLNMLSHDLKTPLSIIEISTWLLEKLSDPAKQREKVESIKEQTQRLEKLIQDILTVSRLETIPEPEFVPLDVNGLIRDLLAKVQPLAEDKRLAIQLDLGTNLGRILADEEDFRRALANLVENAIRYTPDEGTIIVQTWLHDNQIVVAVRDTGIGISDKDLPHIFEHFYRADKARTSDKGGTGLGLAIVKRIIEIHKGQIEVESIPGQGSTFRIGLPAMSGTGSS